MPYTIVVYGKRKPFSAGAHNLVLLSLHHRCVRTAQTFRCRCTQLSLHHLIASSKQKLSPASTCKLSPSSTHKPRPACTHKLSPCSTHNLSPARTQKPRPASTHKLSRVSVQKQALSASSLPVRTSQLAATYITRTRRVLFRIGILCYLC